MSQVIDLDQLSALPRGKRRAAGETLIDLGRELVRSTDQLDSFEQKIMRQANGDRATRRDVSKPKQKRRPRRVRNEFGELVERSELKTVKEEPSLPFSEPAAETVA